MSDWEDNSYQREESNVRSGRGGGRGRGRGRANFNKNNDFHQESGWGNDNNKGYGDNNDNENTGSRGRGRGGGGGRGRGGGRHFEKNSDGNDNLDMGGGGEQAVPEKPRPTYIPPEIDENDCNGVEVGTNFNQNQKIQVKVRGDNVPKHIETFRGSGLREVLLDKLAKCNYTIPTPIQKYSIPIIVNGRDLMASAQTGSGKTVSTYFVFTTC